MAEQLAQKLRLNVLGASQGGTFRSGLWIKDSVKDSRGQPQRLRFVNIGNLTPEGRMERVEAYAADVVLSRLLDGGPTAGVGRPGQAVRPEKKVIATIDVRASRSRHVETSASRPKNWSARRCS